MGWLRKGTVESFWSMEDITTLPFETPKDSTVGFDLLDSSDKLRYSNLSANLCRELPNFLNNSTLLNCFSFLKNKSFAIHQMLPGYILPLHKDKYSHFKKIYNISDVNLIVRAIVFLEDKQPGHILEIENISVDNWKAGDWVAWQGCALHLAANLGTVDRYTLQITGILDEVGNC